MRYFNFLRAILAITFVLLLCEHICKTAIINLTSIITLNPWIELITSNTPACKALSNTSSLIQLPDLLSYYIRNNEIFHSWGKIALLEGNCEAATDAWKKVLLDTPESPTAILGMLLLDESVPDALAERTASYAYFLGAQSGKQASTLWYQRSLALHPNRLATESLASLYIQEGHLNEAINLWEKLAQNLTVKEADYWWALGKVAELHSESNNALVYYQKSIALNASNCDDRFYLALKYRELGDRQSAYNIYTTALSLCANRIEPYLGLGHLAWQQKDYAAALSWYKQTEHIFPNSMEPYYFQGRVFFDMGEFSLASDYFNAALSRSSDNANIFYYLAQCAYQLGNQIAAMDMMQHAISIYETANSGVNYPREWGVLLGEWMIQQGQLENARAVFEKTLERYPGDPEITILLGNIIEKSEP